VQLKFDFVLDQSPVDGPTCIRYRQDMSTKVYPAFIPVSICGHIYTEVSRSHEASHDVAATAWYTPFMTAPARQGSILDPSKEISFGSPDGAGVNHQPGAPYAQVVTKHMGVLWGTEVKVYRLWVGTLNQKKQKQLRTLF